MFSAAPVPKVRLSPKQMIFSPLGVEFRTAGQDENDDFLHIFYLEKRI